MAPRWDALTRPGWAFASRPLPAWVLTILGPALVTLGVVAKFGPVAQLPSVLYAAVVVGAALLGGLRPAVAGSVLSAAGIWYAVLPPGNTFDVHGAGQATEELVALVIFVAIAVAASAFVERLERALDQGRDAQARVAFLAEASEMLASSLDLDATFRRLARLGVDALAEWGTVDLVDETGGVRRVAVAHRDREREHELGQLARYRPLLTLRADLVERVASGEVVAGVVDDGFVPDAMRDDAGVVILRGLAPRSYLLVPLMQDAAVVGAMTFVRGTSEPPFTADEVDLARELARRAAIAIDNTRLYQREHEANQRLVLLGDASRVLASTLDIEQAFRRMAELLVPAMANVCYLDLVHDDHVARFAHVDDAHPEGSLLERWPPDLSGANPIAAALRTGETLLHEEIGEELLLRRAAREPAHLELAMRLGLRSCIVVPLVTRSQVVGALTLFRTGGGRAYTRDDVGVVEVLAQRVAMAVENGRLFVDQRALAETLQRSLLPPALPDHPGVRVAARYLPAGAAMDVGGDWYDVFPVRGGTLAVALGDAAGHGAHAASVMGQLRNALRAYLVEDADPARALTRLDELLTSLEPGEMATVACAIIDTETAMLRYASAGHLPPVLLDGRGGARWLDHRGGPPLGAGWSAGYTATRVETEPGSTLLLYTDGLVEHRRRSLDIDLEHLLDVAGELSAGELEPSALCDALVARLLGDTSPADDVAVLAVQLAALGPELVLRVPADPAVMAAVRRTLRRWLRTIADVGELQMNRIVAAAGEACANALEHAARNPGDTFTVRGRVDDGDIELVVRDAGRWRRRPETNLGNGLVLMNALCDRVDIAIGSDGTEIALRWHAEHVAT